MSQNNKIQKTESQALQSSSLKQRLKDLVVADSKTCNSVEQYIENGKAPSIAKAIKHVGEEQVKLEISAVVVQFIDYIGVRSQFTPSHVDLLVDDLCREFYHLKVSEVYYVFKEARIGKFGELYNNINPVKIMGWFQLYRDNRDIKAADLSIHKHKRLKGNPGSGRTDEFTPGQILGNITKNIIDNNAKNL